MRNPNLAGLLLALSCAGVGVFGGAACKQEQIGEQKLEVVIDGKKKSDVIETVRQSRASGELVQRRHILVDDPQDAVLVLATLDASGFASGASYRREGKKGKRYVELTQRDGRMVVFSRGDDEQFELPMFPVVLTETLHRLKATFAQDVVLLDLENAVARVARLDERGHLVPPAPAPAPTPDDAVLPTHTEPAPFLESRTAVVTTWCRAQALGDGVVDAAKKLALAAKPKLDAERAGGPPSALMAVQIGGGDDSGAALVVACLRALGHPARVVSGRVGAEALRTWAQVHDGTRWIDVDPLDIELDGSSKLAHAALVEGFRGPLTTGLVR